MVSAEKDNLLARYGSARRPEREVARERPDGVSDEVVDAVGKLSEALEVVEHARGKLYEFHRLSGTADRLLQEAVRALRDAGETSLADQADEVLVGRDVIEGRWTFQIVEDYDRCYWSAFRSVEEHIRTRLVGGVPHVYEAEMKKREQTSGASQEQT
jgi:hypothetical protein